MDKAEKIFKAARIITFIGIIVAAYSFIDGTFWRGFGDDELIFLLIFLAVFDLSLLYTTGYFLVHRLPLPEETAEEPLWFRRMFYLAFSPIALIIEFGIFNGFALKKASFLTSYERTLHRSEFRKEVIFYAR